MTINEATEQAYKKGYEDGKPKWISVTEMLPEVNETVIVGDYTDGFVCAVKHLGDGRWKSPDSVLLTEAFTHWMPLPEPPKGE